MMAPALLAWWLCPVSSAIRDGLHSAVVWKRFSTTPSFASCAITGIAIGPPMAEGTPKPMSSISTTTTLGAFAGAFTSNRAGGLALRASSVVIVCVAGSAIGSAVLSSAGPVCACAGMAIAIANRLAANRIEPASPVFRAISLSPTWHALPAPARR